MPYADPEAAKKSRAAYYAKNREAITAKRNAKREADREAYNARQRAYRAADPERFKEYDRNRPEAQKTARRQAVREHSAKIRTSPERVEYLAKWRGTNPDKVARYNAIDKEHNAKRRHLAKHYSITTDEWDAMLRAQGERCAICGTDTPAGRGWHTDHCHTTGKVRGILCIHCNAGLGQFRDSAEVLSKAAEYLRRAAFQR